MQLEVKVLGLEDGTPELGLELSLLVKKDSVDGRKRVTNRILIFR